MRIDGNCLAGGPLNGSHLPIPVDPTLRRSRVAPKPASRPRRVMATPMPKTQRDDAIRADHADGQAVSVLALRYGISKPNVYRILKEGPAR